MSKWVVCVGCNQIRSTSPCTPCSRERQRIRDIQRGSSAHRGYGYDHRMNGSTALSGGSTCPRCGAAYTQDNPVSRDHIIPKAKGGTNSKDNYQEMCKSCNSKKRDNTE